MLRLLSSASAASTIAANVLGIAVTPVVVTLITAAAVTCSSSCGYGSSIHILYFRFGIYREVSQYLNNHVNRIVISAIFFSLVSR